MALLQFGDSGSTGYNNWRVGARGFQNEGIKTSSPGLVLKKTGVSTVHHEFSIVNMGLAIHCITHWQQG